MSRLGLCRRDVGVGATPQPSAAITASTFVTRATFFMAYSIARLLADEPERARLAAAAHRLVTGELRLERTIEPLARWLAG